MVSFKKHEDWKVVENKLLGKKIAVAVVRDQKLLLKFTDQNWVEVTTNESPFSTEITVVFTEWIDDAKEQ